MIVVRFETECMSMGPTWHSNRVDVKAVRSPCAVDILYKQKCVCFSDIFHLSSGVHQPNSYDNKKFPETNKTWVSDVASGSYNWTYLVFQVQAMYHPVLVRPGHS